MFLRDMVKIDKRHHTTSITGRRAIGSPLWTSAPTRVGLFGDSDVPQPPSMVKTVEDLQTCIKKAN